MSIKVMIQDSIVSDLFEVSFNDNVLSALTKYIKREATFKMIDGELKEYGNRFVMKHTDLIKVIEEMAL